MFNGCKFYDWKNEGVSRITVYNVYVAKQIAEYKPNLDIGVSGIKT